MSSMTVPHGTGPRWESRGLCSNLRRMGGVAKLVGSKTDHLEDFFFLRKGCSAQELCTVSGT